VSAFLLPCLLLGCGSAPKAPKEPPGPDATSLAMETLVQARSAEIILSVRWRKMAKVEGIRVDETEPLTQVARGSVVVVIQGLRVEADEVKVKWLPEAEDNVLVHARDVKLFRQVRGQPYEMKGLAMLTMANDQVSFFQ
jgi:hypothetical protein